MDKDINKLIDNIVWWIPFKKLRNDLRDLLKYNIDKEIRLQEIENKLNGIISNNDKLQHLSNQMINYQARLNHIDTYVSDLHDDVFNEDIYNFSAEFYGSPQYKISQIIKYGKLYNCKILVETGTLFGDTPYACRRYFDKIYTIELSHDLYLKAVERFKPYNNVVCLEGDSTYVLKDLINSLNERTIFWLDGHYSGGITAKGEKETPIFEELKTIFNHNIKDHIILIDDARCFENPEYWNDYPTIKELEYYVRGYFPKCDFKLKNDIIRIQTRPDQTRPDQTRPDLILYAMVA